MNTTIAPALSKTNKMWCLKLHSAQSWWGGAGEVGLRTLGTGVSPYSGSAVHRQVLNRLRNFLLYSPFQRVTTIRRTAFTPCDLANWPQREDFRVTRRNGG